MFRSSKPLSRELKNTKSTQTMSSTSRGQDHHTFGGGAVVNEDEGNSEVSLQTFVRMNGYPSPRVRTLIPIPVRPKSVVKKVENSAQRKSSLKKSLSSYGNLESPNADDSKNQGKDKTPRVIKAKVDTKGIDLAKMRFTAKCISEWFEKKHEERTKNVVNPKNRPKSFTQLSGGVKNEIKLAIERKLNLISTEDGSLQTLFHEDVQSGSSSTDIQNGMYTNRRFTTDYKQDDWSTSTSSSMKPDIFTSDLANIEEDIGNNRTNLKGSEGALPVIQIDEASGSSVEGEPNAFNGETLNDYDGFI